VYKGDDYREWYGDGECQHPISSEWINLFSKEIKKMLNKIFFKDFSNFNFRKKKWEMKKKNKEGETQFVINYHTPFHEPKNSDILYPLFLIEKLVIWF